MSKNTATISKRRRWATEEKVMKANHVPHNIPLTTANMLEVGGLNWTVEKSVVKFDHSDSIDREMALLTGHDAPSTTHAWPRHSVLKRSDNGAPLGLCGTDSYGEISNHEMVGLALAICEGYEGELRPTNIGLFGDGQRVFMEFELPRLMVADDVFEPFLFLLSSHDGSGALRIGTRARRLSCTNQIAGFRRKESTHVIAHRAGAIDKVEKARMALNIARVGVAAFELEVAAMIQTEITEPVVIETTKKLFGWDASETGRAQTIAEDRVSEVLSMYRNDPRVGYTGTVWGLTQAVSTWQQHSQGKSKTSAERHDAAFLASMGDVTPLELKLVNLLQRQELVSF
jgi:phage/plasmid-like protein (TIGR03299 family)